MLAVHRIVTAWKLKLHLQCYVCTRSHCDVGNSLLVSVEFVLRSARYSLPQGGAALQYGVRSMQGISFILSALICASARQHNAQHGTALGAFAQAHGSHCAETRQLRNFCRAQLFISKISFSFAWLFC